MMLKSFNTGDAKALVDRTHPSIYKLMNGQNNFEKNLIAGAKQIIECGIVIESLNVGLPDRLYRAGHEYVCFVPKTSIMQNGDKRFKSISYIVAIKGNDAKWRYLDGAGARRNPNQLWKLLPRLPKTIELPENTISLIEAD